LKVGGEKNLLTKNWLIFMSHNRLLSTDYIDQKNWPKKSVV